MAKHYRLYLGVNRSFRLDEMDGEAPEVEAFVVAGVVDVPAYSYVYERQGYFDHGTATVWIYRQRLGERKPPILWLDPLGLDRLVTALIDVGAVNGKYYQGEV